jgi:hypothetical protein
LRRRRRRKKKKKKQLYLVGWKARKEKRMW